jgi:hypothetical protein
MARYNPTAPDSLYGELQPETFGAGMRQEHFGPEITAMMLPTKGVSQFERDRALEDFQKNIMPLQQSLAQARAMQDKQAMDLAKFRMTQEGHRMSLRSADLSARKAQFDYQKTIDDANREASIARRMPIVIGQLDGINRDPTLNTFQKASEAAQLQGQYAPLIAKSPALKSLFDAYQISNSAERAGETQARAIETQAWQKGIQLGQYGYGPTTTIPDFAAGQKAKQTAAIAKEGRDDQIKKLNAEVEYLDGLEKRLDDLGTVYHAADPAAGLDPAAAQAAREAAGQYGGTAPPVDRTMPKVYTPEARDDAIFIAQRIGEHLGMNKQQIEELVKKADDMPSFVPLLKNGLWDLRNRNYEQKGLIFNYGSTGGTTSPTAPSIGSWGAPSGVVIPPSRGTPVPMPHYEIEGRGTPVPMPHYEIEGRGTPL